MSSCAGGHQKRSRMTGETLYLDGTRSGSVQGLALQMQQRAPIEAWWKGDGVSGAPKVVISLGEQKAYFYKGEQLVGLSSVSTGEENHPTPTGSFTIQQKSPAHRSGQYGDYVDASGNVVVENIENGVDPKPPGTRYRGASMPHFMRFNRGIGMHAGYLPGYPASHGCVRMPDHMAETFYRHVSIGTPVVVKR
jgi:lipoprotein-anchoring transpeptidase ErfK/SrfK